MTCGSSGTGINDSIPEVEDREGNGKESFPTLGNGKGINIIYQITIPTTWEREGKQKNTFLNGKGMNKSISEIREREGNEKIHSHNLGMGIRGFHSGQWTGTRIPALP